TNSQSPVRSMGSQRRYYPFVKADPASDAAVNRGGQSDRTAGLRPDQERNFLPDQPLSRAAPPPRSCSAAIPDPSLVPRSSTARGPRQLRKTQLGHSAAL